MNSRFKWTIVGSSTCVVVLLLIGANKGRAVAADDIYGHLKVYTEVLERIKLEYVEEPDMKSVTLGAINGLLEVGRSICKLFERGSISAIRKS